MTPLEITHPLELDYTFLEMTLLEEMSYYYDAELLENLISQGEATFPDAPFFPAARAFPYIVQGELHEATKWLDIASGLGDHHIIHHFRGMISDHSGFWFEADKHFERAVERFPNVPRARRALAQNCYHRGYYEEAFLHIIHYVRLVGFTDQSLDLLLSYYDELKDYPTHMTLDLMNFAIEFLNRLPQNPWAHAYYASICGKRYNALIQMLNDGQDVYQEDFDEMRQEMQEHWFNSAVLSDDSCPHFRNIFKGYIQEMILPNSSPSYVFRLKLRYLHQRGIHLLKKKWPIA